MGSFVEIKTSIGDIVGIANRLSDRGGTLRDDMQGATERVTELENHEECLPPDQFTEPFLVNYHQAVDNGDGETIPANQAIKQSAIGLGQALQDLGEKVSTAMWSYAGTDDDNATDIRQTNT